MLDKLIKIVFPIVLFSITCHSFAQKKVEFNTQSFPPYSFVQNGELAGAISELTADACEEIRVECSFVYNRYWQRGIQKVKDGKSDALFVVGKNEKREKWLNFSLPIIPAEYGFFSLKDQMKFTELSDLSGLRVSVLGMSNMAHQLELVNQTMQQKNIPPITISWALSTEDAIEQMLRGKADIMYSNKAVGNAYNEKIPAAFRMHYMGKHLDLHYYIAFNKNTVTAKFVEKFNRALIKLDRRGEIKRLFKKYNLPYMKIAN